MKYQVTNEEELTVFSSALQYFAESAVIQGVDIPSEALHNRLQKKVSKINSFPTELTLDARSLKHLLKVLFHYIVYKKLPESNTKNPTKELDFLSNKNVLENRIYQNLVDLGDDERNRLEEFVQSLRTS